jgi:hypothetical protein
VLGRTQRLGERFSPQRLSVCLSVEKSLACSTVPAYRLPMQNHFPFLPLLSLYSCQFLRFFLTRYSPGQLSYAILWRVAIDGCFGGLYFRTHGWSA